MTIDAVQFGSNLRPSTVDVMNALNDVIAKMNNVEARYELWRAPASWDITAGWEIELSDNFTNYDYLEVTFKNNDNIIMPVVRIPDPANGMLFNSVSVYMQRPYAHIKSAICTLKNDNMIGYVKGYNDEWITGEFSANASGANIFSYVFNVSPILVVGVKK